MRRKDTQQLFGLPVRPLLREAAVSLAEEAIRAQRPIVFGMLNAAKVVGMRRDPALYRSVVASDVLLADGMSIVWAGRILGMPLPERVTGIDLMHGLLERAGREGWRVFFLGATEEVLAGAIARASERYPGMVLAGSHHGYFTEDEEGAIAAAIRRASPDLLFVGMGSPKKERFLARWADETGALVSHGVGGSFDVLAGLVKRAPQTVQAAGLEWLWRVAQEPRRLWRRYLVTNTSFSLMVAEAWLSRLFPARLRGVADPLWMPGKEEMRVEPGAGLPEASDPAAGIRAASGDR